MSSGTTSLRNGTTSGRAGDLQEAGKLDEAIAVGEQMLHVEQQIYGEANSETAFTLDWLYDLCIEADRIDDAREAAAGSRSRAHYTATTTIA